MTQHTGTGQAGPELDAPSIAADELTLELNSVFIGITRATTKRAEAHMASFNLTPARVAVISILYRHSRPLTVGEIAHGLHVSSTNISRRLDGLEQDGWVQRERNPEDGRSIYISLTDYGRGQADMIMPLVFRRVNDVWSCYTPEEKQELLIYLERFLKHILSLPPPVPMGGK